MLVVGLTVFANPPRIPRDGRGIHGEPGRMYLSGLLLMPAGRAIVLTHNGWTAVWRVLITLLGLAHRDRRRAAPVWAAVCVKAGQAMLNKPYFTSIAAAIWVVLDCCFAFLDICADKTHLRKGATP